MDLKESLEQSEIKKDIVTIASVDAVNMYPLIKLATIRKDIRFFTRVLRSVTKKKILCLWLIRFGMSSTLVSVEGDYCE